MDTFPTTGATLPAPGRPGGVAARWLHALLAGLVAALMMAVLGAAQASPSPSGASATAASNLGIGPALGPWHDPVRSLAIDIAEHLPAQAGSVTADPLPLHAPWLPLESLALDELQGVESAGPGTADCCVAPMAQSPAATDVTRFASIDPRLHDRPPTDPDRPRP